MRVYDRQVFLNVPFDARYKKLLRALAFSVHECGLVARCAQEKDDGGQVQRMILALLFGVAPHDPMTLGLVAGVMATVGIVACWIPAARAAKIDPWVAVRVP